MSKKVNIAAKPKRVEAVEAEEWVKGSSRMKRLTIDVPEDLHRRIKTSCAANGTKMADQIREILEREFPEMAL